MKNEDIRNLNDAELKAAIAETQESLTRLKFSHAISEIENKASLGDLRKTVARLKTEKRARELAQK